MTFFLAGYAVVWAVVFVYTLMIKIGQRKLEQELTLLEELVHRQNKAS